MKTKQDYTFTDAFFGRIYKEDGTHATSFWFSLVVAATIVATVTAFNVSGGNPFYAIGVFLLLFILWFIMSLTRSSKFEGKNIFANSQINIDKSVTKINSDNDNRQITINDHSDHSKYNYENHTDSRDQSTHIDNSKHNSENSSESLVDNSYHDSSITNNNPVVEQQIASNDDTLNIDEDLENLVRADLTDFLDGLCNNGDMERLIQQIISFLNGKKLGKASPIKLKYGSLEITQQYIKAEVSYYAYKIWLILKKKKVLQKEISSHFFETFGVNFPKTEREDFRAKLRERYEEYPKIKKGKGF